MPAQAPSPASALAARLLRVRWIVRAPVWLYRARPGFVFGSRLLMLEHTGRETGIRRYVVLEAVDHPDPHTHIVAAGCASASAGDDKSRHRPFGKGTAGPSRTDGG